MPNKDLETFQQMVLADVQLQTELRDLMDQDEFLARVLKLGLERGYDFDIADIKEAMRDGRKGRSLNR